MNTRRIRRLLCPIVLLTVLAATSLGQEKEELRARGEIIGVQKYTLWPTNMDGFSVPLLIRILDDGKTADRRFVVATTLAGGPIMEFYDYYSTGSCFDLKLVREERFDRPTRRLIKGYGFVLAGNIERNLVLRQKNLPWYIVLKDIRCTCSPRSPH